MKRYLNKNQLKIKFFLTLLFFGVSACFSNSFAQTKVEYYKKLFGKEFGFKIYEEDTKKADKEDYLSSDLNKGYVVNLSSSILTEDTGNKDIVESDLQSADTNAYYFGPNKKVILICDSDFSSNYPFEFSCNRESVNSTQVPTLGGFLKSGEFENTDLYVIPESLLLSPEERSDIQNYFIAIQRSDKASEGSEDAKSQEEGVSLISKIKKFTNTTTFEFFKLSISMFVIAVFSSGFLRFLSKEDRKFSFSELGRFLYANKRMPVYRKIILVILLFSLASYVSLIMFLAVKDGQGINLGYLISYSIDSFKMVTESTVRAFVELFQIGLLFLFIAFFAPLFVNSFKLAFFKISNAVMKQDVVKFTIPSILIISLFTSSFFEISSSVGFLIFLIIVLAFVFFSNLKSRNFFFNYSKKEKTIFIILALIILCGGFLWKLRQSGMESIYKKENLIGVTGKVVFLPYSKQLGEETLINEYKFSASEPIFVDQYLVYSPNNTKIENKDAKEFRNEGVFYIQNGNVKDIVSAIYSNKDLEDELQSDLPTNFFKINNTNIERVFSDSKPEIQITFSCKREDLGMEKIKADYYYLENGEVKNENKTLLYFPGCTQVNEPEVFKAGFDLPFTESEYIFVRLVDVLRSDIENIKIINGDEIVEPVYFSKSKGFEIIDSGGLENSAFLPVTNYIFGDFCDLSFGINLDEEGKFDISVPINELIKEGELKDRFLIWSTKKYLPVRLSD